MKHYGDITKINGAAVEPVDIITGGSPCQDLSVAGKRAGLAGARSGLFMDQIRIIKEMRENDKLHSNRANDDIRPRFMVWENVAGAFSSNDGEDFRAVLEETARVAAPGVSIPRPEGGRWANAGCIMGDRYSIAWRLHDAQFWGVPQRRKRIALVADFGGQSAAEILFERKGVRGDFEPGEQTGQAAAASFGNGVEAAGAISFQERAGKPGGGKGILIQAEHVGALCSGSVQSVFRKTGHPVNAEAGQGWEDARVNDTLNAFDNDESRTPTLVLAAAEKSVNNKNVTRVGTAVRRLTPTECERLQGFPDGWTDIGEWKDSKGKLHKDSDGPRYRALGNSIALPFWAWMAERMVAVLGGRPTTMASLFDGIGGFPLVFARCGCVPIWASEIEEFPMAVTRKHFPEV